MHLQKYKKIWNYKQNNGKICIFCLKSLDVDEIMLIFAPRMRVAYRRDYIKLRNRSFIQSRWSSTCGFSF